MNIKPEDDSKMVDTMKETVSIKSKHIEVESCEYQNYIPLWLKPNPKQEWIIQPDGSYVSSLFLKSEERSATLSDLVVDLVYVILLSSLSRAFRATVDDHPLVALRDLFALFSPIWHSWFSIARFLNQFEEKDAVFTLFFFSNLIVSAVLAINAESCGTAEDRTGCSHFVWTIAGLRLLTVVGYLYVWYFNPRYNKFFKARIFNDVVRMFLWFITGFFFPVPGDSCHDKDPSDRCWAPFIGFWWTAWFADNLNWIHAYYLINSNYYSKKSENIPIDTKISSERNSLFAVIALGEIITAALVSGGESEHHRRRLQIHNADDHNYTVSSLAPVSLIVIMAGLIKLLLFDFNPTPSPTGTTCGQHALNRNFRTGTIWIYMQMPLNACFVIIGALLEPLKAEAEISYNASLLLSITLACIILIVTILDLQHCERAKGRRVKPMYRVVICFCFAFTIVGLWFLDDWHESPKLATDFVLILDIILAFYVVYIFYSHLPAVDNNNKVSENYDIGHTFEKALLEERNDDDITDSNKHADAYYD